MSRRDFEMIAACIYAASFGDPKPDYLQADRRLKLAQCLADNFTLIYPRFNRAKFIHACMTGDMS